MEPVQKADAEPQNQARAVRDPTHPHASPVTGVIPPPEHRFPPGKSGNPGGRRKGASIVHELERRLAKGAQFDENGELVQAGTEACEIAESLIAVSKGARDPSEVDVKAALAIMERVDGPVVKEQITYDGGEIANGITLEDGTTAKLPVAGK